jgi:hypothetical protein
VSATSKKRAAGYQQEELPATGYQLPARRAAGYQLPARRELPATSYQL